MKSKPSLMHAWWVSQCTFGISSKSWTAHSSIAYDHLLDTYLIIVISFGGPSKDRSYALSRVSLWFMLSTARRYLCVVWPPMFYPWVCHAFSQKLFHGTQDILLSPFCLLAFSYPGTPISHSYLTRSRHTLLTQHTHTHPWRKTVSTSFAHKPTIAFATRKLSFTWTRRTYLYASTMIES